MKIAMTCDATSEFNTMLGITERTRKCIDESVHDIMNRQLFRILAIDQACKYMSKVSADSASPCSHVHHDEEESMRYYDHERIEYLFCK